VSFPSLLHHSLSTKTKTMFLVLGLFIAMATLFSVLRYMDVKAAIEKSRQDYTSQIHNIYHTALVRIGEFYTNRGYANLDSYGIKEALYHKDSTKLRELSQQRWNILKQENPFLLDMRFYDTSGESIVAIENKGKNTLISKKHFPLSVTFDFLFRNNESTYHITIPAYHNNQAIGTLEFTILSDYFLHEIEQFSGLKGYILSPFSPLLIDDAKLKKLSTTHGDISHSGAKTYITHAIHMQSSILQCTSQLLFFQDISDQQEKLLNAIYEAFFLSLGMLSIIIIALHYGFEVLIKRLEESESSLRHLNHTLEERVNQEIQKRYENEQMLLHQSRLASMGEMIGNIAHQWRQPLTELSATLVHLSFLHDLGSLNTQTMQASLGKAETLILHMSKTIDDFRNFFASDHEEELFCAYEAIQKAVMLIDSALKNNHITLHLETTNSCLILGYPRQFAQVILNIIGNAKDILLERQIKEPTITITLTCKDNTTCICIADNGGGISVDPIEKIFEPYVSTKHAISGTGIGLYMSKTIIEKNSKGSLRAYNNKEGAVFEILFSA